MKTLKGFKDFITRGNVVDLAVGVVIGAAFTTVVSGFTDSFLTPLINMIGGVQFGGKIPLPGPEKNAITWGVFLSKIFGFMITAAVVYFFVVVPLNRFFKKEQKSDTPSEEVLLLREIRDALKAGQAVTPQQRQELSGEKVQ